jgi:arylsulfatase A-like enzyme
MRASTRHLLIVIFVALAPAMSVRELRGADRPNFVWILSEDNSANYLKLYDPLGAETPNIAALARDGLIFEHAFSNSPVCSVARTTLITSVYAPRLGTQYHRKIYPVPLPQGWKMFPAFLRQAGYYTTNKVKKDYNAEETPGTWDASSRKASWRNRPDAEQPFFHMQSFAESHESSLHFTKQEMEKNRTTTDPDSVTLAPNHPDTPTFRYTHARYLDRMGVIDQRVGMIVGQLEQDGLLDETFVFYFGDHGGVLPGSKGYLYESGLHVPLVVRIPEKYRHLVDAERGTRLNGFVSFIDFGPTLLHLAGVEVPSYMDGRPFLGSGISNDELNQRNESFGYADRFDEKYEMVRTLRKGSIKYHRNFQCYYPDALQNNYRYRMLAYTEWRQLFREGKLNETQRAFFEPKQPESLFDLAADPYETVNLANDPRYAETLATMREELQEKMLSCPDLSLLPEPVMIQQLKAAKKDGPLEVAAENSDLFPELLEHANLCLQPFQQAKPQLQQGLKSLQPEIVYWTLNACCCFGKEANSLANAARGLLQHPNELVRLRAAVFLAILGTDDPQPHLLRILRESDDATVNLMVLNDIVYLRDTRGYAFQFTADDVKVKNGEVERRIEYLCSK